MPNLLVITGSRYNRYRYNHACIYETGLQHQIYSFYAVARYNRSRYLRFLLYLIFLCQLEIFLCDGKVFFFFFFLFMDFKLTIVHTLCLF